MTTTASDVLSPIENKSLDHFLRLYYWQSGKAIEFKENCFARGNESILRRKSKRKFERENIATRCAGGVKVTKQYNSISRCLPPGIIIPLVVMQFLLIQIKEGSSHRLLTNLRDHQKVIPWV